MSVPIQAVRGMNDILPRETPNWQYVEGIFKRVLASCGYQEIRFPILEKTELFKRSIGATTDIVEKEMYTFIDTNNTSLSLRPEGTASCVRAAIEHGLLHNKIQRLWYMGPFFRHERPQKGRLRQFHQASAEVFGLDSSDLDAELIAITAQVLTKLGIKDYTRLQLNSLGTKQTRSEYRNALVTYFNRYKHDLDEDSLRRLNINPLRILDSKNHDLKDIIAHAPQLLDFLDQASQTHFEELQMYLSHAGIQFEINPTLVRGLDYYTKTVFEWVSDKIGAQATVCAGGRYDGLVEELGGKPTPAAGFSLGIERTILLLENTQPADAPETLHAYFIMDNPQHTGMALKIANYLRAHVSGLRLMMHCGGGTLKNQFRKADKSGALFAIILGEHEIKTHTLALKNLREDIPQQTLYQDELVEYLKLKIGHK